jgi:hypothetical protein
MLGAIRSAIRQSCNSGKSVVAVIFLGMLIAGCSKAETTDGAFDSSRLPRVAGAKEIFASPAVTNFTSPDPVAQTADTLEKALAGGGWQNYIAPNTAYANDPSMRMMSLKKGSQGLSVYISVAPAQNNATSVQYSALPLKTDLPFTKDASNIEYSPERALLTLVTAEPVDKTLDFYRKELGALGWALWSEKTNAKQAADGPSGVVTERGGYAHYITDKDPTVTLVLTLQKADDGKSKVEIKQYPVGILEPLYQANINSDNYNAPQVEVSKLPRLEGAKEVGDRSSADRLVYSVPGSVEATIAATRKLLAADGWKQYVAPMEENSTLLAFKKGRQGLSVSFSGTSGQPGQSSVYYSPTRLNFALAIPDDASAIVFDENRPYLRLVTGGTAEATRDFFQKQLVASGWSPLSATDAAAKWPNAKPGEKATGTLAYYIRGTQRIISLSLQAGENGKTNAEIRVPGFAQPQNIEFDKEVFGFPQPKLFKSAGGTGGDIQREAHAHVPAEVPTVLAFYRRELASRNWKEEAQGAVITPDEVLLNFNSEAGTLALKLGHKYDLTIANLVHQVAKPVAKAEPVARGNSIDAMLKDAQQMMSEAEALSGGKQAQAVPQAGGDPAAPLGVLAGNAAPVPVPDTAEDVEFADGKLEFSSPSSVINNANMVVLNFSKARNSVSFTIMKMGNKTNVSADGSALEAAAAKPATSDKSAAVDSPSQPATADDLIVEEMSGLPLPKRHTLSEGTSTPFFHELNANVPLDLAAVLGFYRGELGKRNWKEETAGAVTGPDKVNLVYTAPEGPALLKLARKDGETTVNLTVKNPDAVAKAGIAPKPNQAKVLFGNINDAEAAITFNGRAIKVAAAAGTKGPDGPALDIAGGKYKYSIKLPGKPVQNDELEIGAGEIWGLMIGPGGVLALRVY